jgi:arylsulfatase
MFQGIRGGISAGVFSALVLYLVLVVSFNHLFETTTDYVVALLLLVTQSSVHFGCLGFAVGVLWWFVFRAARRSPDFQRASSLCAASCFTLAGAFFTAAWVVFDLYPNRENDTRLALLVLVAGALVVLWVLSRPRLRSIVSAFSLSKETVLAVLVVAAVGTAVGFRVRPESLTTMPDRFAGPVEPTRWMGDTELASVVASTKERIEAQELDKAQNQDVELMELVREAKGDVSDAPGAGGEEEGEAVDEHQSREPGDENRPEEGRGPDRPSEPEEDVRHEELGDDARPVEARDEDLFGEAGDEDRSIDEGSEGREVYNILLLTVGTLRADHLGCYGYPRETSPSVDSLAAEGVLFLNAYAQRPKTSPSFATTMTGAYPQYHGVRRAGRVLPDAAYTMAEMMKDLGYATCGVVTDKSLSPEIGFDQGFDEYFFGHSGAREGSKIAIEWLSENRSKPFFLWVHHADPHAPYEPPPPYDESFVGVVGALRGCESRGARGGENSGSRSDAGRGDRTRALEIVRPGGLGGVFGDLIIDGPLDRDYYISQYDGEIAFTDGRNGELLSALRALGSDDSTLVVFTSDHGESLGEHDYYFRHGLFAHDASARIPLVVSLSGVVEGGAVDDGVVESVDLLPTILDIIGAEVPSSCQGESFALGMIPGLRESAASGDTQEENVEVPGPVRASTGTREEPPMDRGYAYIEAGYGPHSGPGYTYAVTDGRLKLIMRDSAWVIRPRTVREFLYCLNALFEGGADPPELYDTSRDPDECVNIFSQRPNEARLLEMELLSFLENVRKDGRLPPNAD